MERCSTATVRARSLVICMAALTTISLCSVVLFSSNLESSWSSWISPQIYHLAPNTSHFKFIHLMGGDDYDEKESFHLYREVGAATQSKRLTLRESVQRLSNDTVLSSNRKETPGSAETLLSSVTISPSQILHYSTTDSHYRARHEKTAENRTVEHKAASTIKHLPNLSYSTTHAHDRKPHVSQNNSLSSLSTCTESNCLEFLSTVEKLVVKRCEEKTHRERIGVKIEQGTCKFLPYSHRGAVALASPEGSGNTWLRGLLEKATGICTGFCSCDIEMRLRGFLGENIISGKVLVVKTHLSHPQWIGEARKVKWEGSYGSAVVLIRNPAKSLIAERNRRMTNRMKKIKDGKQTNGSHLNAVPEAVFVDKDWNDFIQKYLKQWKIRLDNWVFNNHDHPVHVVSYEDLQRDTVGEVEKILDFLKFSYTHDDLVERLKQDYSDFQRPHSHDTDFQHFSPEQKDYVRNTLMDMIELAKKAGKMDLFHFDEYIDALDNIR